MTNPDVVYIVGPDAAREESLRYSLRSLDEFGAPHDRVWIVGTVPSWVAGVHELPLSPVPDKFANQRRSLVAACEASDADQIVVFNDDHFVTSPLGEWPTFHLGPTSKYINHLLDTKACGAGNTWLRAVADTADWMAARGHGDVLAYEAHVPLLFDRQKLAQALSEYPDDKRLAVGEMYAEAGAGGEGENAGNAKVQHLTPSEFHLKVDQRLPFLSSNTETFEKGLVGGYIRGMFRDVSGYEL